MVPEEGNRVTLGNQQNHFKVILLTGEKYNRKCNEKKNVAFMLLFFSVLSLSYVVIDSDSDDEYIPEKKKPKIREINHKGKYTTNLEKELCSAASPCTVISG